MPPLSQTPIDRAPSPIAGPWVAIQRNRRSGRGRQYRPVMELIHELRRLGLSSRLFSRREELDRVLTDPHQPPPVAVVAAGGDGTVVDLLNRHPEHPLAVLPLGTENLIAWHFGIPRRDGRFTARMIAAGKSQRIDLGDIDGRRFAIMASCGLDATVLHRTHAARRGHITQLSYLGPLLHSLWHYDYPRLQVSIDDNPTPLEGGMVIVANLPPYALRMPLSPPADAFDGRLHVRVYRHGSTFQLLRDLANVHWRWGRPWPGCEDAIATRVRITSDRPTPVQADGDPAGMTPVEIGIIPSASTLVVPGG